MKEVSAAIVYTNKKFFLAVHPTGSEPDFWDLPKGLIEKGELPEVTAMREFQEETGIKIKKENLRYIGAYMLHATKYVLLYVCIVNTLPSLSKYVCKSMTSAYSDPVPEVDKFTYFKLSDYHALRGGFHKAMRNVLEKMKGE